MQYREFVELSPVTRGDDIVIPKPYAGVAMFRDGRYIIAGRDRPLLVLVGADQLVIASGNPFSLRHKWDNLICYGIALHCNEKTLYMLVGEKNSTELWVTRIEVGGDNTFLWKPSFDVRLPSVAARNTTYNDKKIVKWGWSHVPGGYSHEALQWRTALLKPKSGDPTELFHAEDELAIELEPFNSLGAILPEYTPSITSLGSRVMVGCTNVQVYQVSFDMQMSYEWPATKASVISTWERWFDKNFNAKGKVNFQYGEDRHWWVEEVHPGYAYTNIILHTHVTFQYPFLASSVVTIHPDLARIEGITHVGSSIVCSLPTMVDVPAKSVEPSPYTHMHYDKKRFILTNIAAAEADVELHLSRQNYVIPSNVLAWSNSPPYAVNQVTVSQTYTKMLEWWHSTQVPFMQTTDPVAYVRKYPQLFQTTIIGHLRERELNQVTTPSIMDARTVTSYDINLPTYPWSAVEGIQDISMEICSGQVMAVTPSKILRGQIALHKFVTRYKGRVLGEGCDVYVGKVIKGTPKIVAVDFVHDTYSRIHLSDVHIRIVPDTDYPYYMYVQLSPDGVTWGMDVTYTTFQIQPLPSDESSFTFFVKIESSSTIEDPKPVLLEADYRRVGQ